MKFTTTIKPFGPAAAIELSDDQVAELGGGKRAAVIVRVGDRVARLRVAVMGGCNVIGLSKATRATLGVDSGDEVVVEVDLDTQDRVVEVPAALADVLAADADAAALFDRLSYTHRKEFARWVTDARREETRKSRLGKIPAMLREGRTL